MSSTNEAAAASRQAEEQRLQQHINSPTCFPHPSGNSCNSGSQSPSTTPSQGNVNDPNRR